MEPDLGTFIEVRALYAAPSKRGAGAVDPPTQKPTAEAVGFRGWLPLCDLNTRPSD